MGNAKDQKKNRHENTHRIYYRAGIAGAIPNRLHRHMGRRWEPLGDDRRRRRGKSYPLSKIAMPKEPTDCEECEGTGKRSFYECDELVDCVDCNGTGKAEKP